MMTHPTGLQTKSHSTGLDKDSINSNILSVKPERRKILKIHIDLPWGGSLDIEREPMEFDRFCLLCMLAAGAMLVALLMSAGK